MVSCGPVKKRCSWFLQSVSVCSSFAGAAQAVRSLCQRKLSQVRVTGLVGLVQKWKMLGSRIREVWGTWIHLAAPANQHAFGMHLRIMKQMVSVHLVRTPLHHVCVIRSHCAVSLVWLCSMAQTAHVNNTCVPSWTYALPCFAIITQDCVGTLQPHCYRHVRMCNLSERGRDTACYAFNYLFIDLPGHNPQWKWKNNIKCGTLGWFSLTCPFAFCQRSLAFSAFITMQASPAPTSLPLGSIQVHLMAGQPNWYQTCRNPKEYDDIKCMYRSYPCTCI